MAKPQLEKTITGLAGEFLVAGRLCLKGYVASLTLKNYPGVDIFCLNPKNGKQSAVQVKTIRGGAAYYVPENVGNRQQTFVFVRINNDESADYFIVPSEIVDARSKDERDQYLREHPGANVKQPRMLNISSIESFRNRWDLLGLE